MMECGKRPLRNIFIKLFIIIILAGSLWFIFNSVEQNFNMKYAISSNKNIYGFVGIDDLKRIPQSSTALEDEGTDTGYDTFDKYYIEYFKPWDNEYNFSKDKISGLFDKELSYFSESYIKYPDSFYEDLKSNANLDAVSSVMQKAILINNTTHRIYPTLSYLFNHPNEPGEGYPFDNAQDDFLRIGEPILVSHYTKDREFVYALTSSGSSAFIPAKDISFVTEGFIEEFKKKLVIITEDRQGFLDEKNNYPQDVFIGMTLPFDSEGCVLIPYRDMNNSTALKKLYLEKNSYIDKPYYFNKKNVSSLVDKLVNKNYTWGGALPHRDCAKILKDYFACFGVHIVLLSKDQAKQGSVVDISKNTSSEKIDSILNGAIPYQSTVFRPGHIVLYLGKYKGEPIVLQALWGLKLYDNNDLEHRLVIGKSIISSLNPGKELKGFKDRWGFLGRATSFSNQFKK